MGAPVTNVSQAERSRRQQDDVRTREQLQVRDAGIFTGKDVAPDVRDLAIRDLCMVSVRYPVAEDGHAGSQERCANDHEDSDPRDQTSPLPCRDHAVDEKGEEERASLWPRERDA